MIDPAARATGGHPAERIKDARRRLCRLAKASRGRRAATRTQLFPVCGRKCVRTAFRCRVRHPGVPGRGIDHLGCATVLIELQAHSTHSDGQLEAAGVVEEAAKAGVTTLALTDHDAVAGVPEAAEAA